MTTEFTIDSGFATLVASGVAAFIAINTFFFTWLRSSFHYLAKKIDLVSADVDVLQEKHETLDQHRHEENLRRFEKVSVALAKLGSENGTH